MRKWGGKLHPNPKVTNNIPRLSLPQRFMEFLEYQLGVASLPDAILHRQNFSHHDGNPWFYFFFFCVLSVSFIVMLYAGTQLHRTKIVPEPKYWIDKPRSRFSPISMIF